MKKRLPLVITVAVLLGFVVAFLWIPKTYSIYKDAMALAKQDSYVFEQVGANLADGIFVYSKIQRGYAEIEIPISGDKASGMLLVRGKKTNHQWQLTEVYFYPGNKSEASKKGRKSIFHHQY